MQIDSEVFKQVHAKLEAMHHQLVKDILENLPEESPTLYHYTSLDSALKIVESEKIYLTNMRYLNDPSELICGIEIADAIITEIENEYYKADKKLIALLLAALKSRILISFTTLSERATRIDKYLQDFALKYDELQISWLRSLFEEEWYFYIACFSKRDDDLRQWIPYSDQAKGAALGFKGVEKNVHSLSDEDDLYIISVCYKDDDTKKDFLRKFIKEALDYFEANQELFRNGLSDNINHPLHSFMHSMTELLVADLVACKSEHYKDEEEWRLFYHTTERRIKNGSRHPSFFVKNGILKPYLDFAINLKSLVDVRLAPQCEENPNKDAFIMLLRKHGIELPSISKSKIPYRG